MRRKAASRWSRAGEERIGAGRRVRALLRGQPAIIRHDQLIECGVHASTIRRRVRAGRLTVVHRGVYLASPVMPPLGEEMAAVLACCNHAYASHASAAYLHQLPPYPAKARPAEVTVQGRKVDRPGIATDCVRELRQDEVTQIENIPVTSLARTVLDLAAVVSPGALERLVAEVYTRDVAESDLRRLLDRYPRRRGTRALRALLDRDRGPRITDSEAERRFLALVRAAGLPEPRTGNRIGPHEVDFLWPEHRVVVEVDGFRFHSSRSRFEADRRRDQGLIALGYVVIRVTWAHIVDEPHVLVARVAAALARAEV